MITNIFSDIPERLPDELIKIISETDKIRIEKIVSRGHVSREWYDQDKDEFVLLLRGEARLRFEKGDRTVHMKQGDYLIIPAHERHWVEWTSNVEDTVWLAVHYE
jgi:cupin 2 domain-containing protein